MSLSDELRDLLATGRANKRNKGCYTCKWLALLPKDDLDAFNTWIAANKSLSQLWQICIEQDPPLDVSLSGLRWHMMHHDQWV